MTQVEAQDPLPPLEEVIDALFQGPLSAFVKARNAAAKRRRATDPTGADRVHALAKPSVSAWAVNQLWWTQRASFDELRRAGASLVALQRAGNSVAGQQPNEDRRAAIATLVSQATDILTEAGHGTAMATLRKITQSLEASAAWGESLPTPGPGRLSTDLAPPGFGQVAGFGMPAPRATGPATDKRSAQAALELERATRELADARTVLTAAQTARARAQAALVRAEQTLAETRAVEAAAEQRSRAAISAYENAAGADAPAADVGPSAEADGPDAL